MCCNVNEVFSVLEATRTQLAMFLDFSSFNTTEKKNETEAGMKEQRLAV
jgi:hypothetical protein